MITNKGFRYKMDCLLGLVVELGFVNATRVEQVRAETVAGQSVMATLLERGLITEALILRASGVQFAADIITLSEVSIAPEIIKLIKPDVAWEHNIVPVAKSESRVVVAVEDPTNLNTIDSLGYLLHAEIEIRIAGTKDIEAALKQYYPDGEEAGKALHQEVEGAFLGGS